MGYLSNTPPRQRGFTLVELAVVLVIIGLLIGGVLVGRDLIRGAEIQSLLTDKDKYTTAIRVFRLKYNALPGDMTNATYYWGTDAGCPLSDTTQKVATCDGNGNGIIEYLDATYWREYLRIWQHLSNAGLIPGMYVGTYLPAPDFFAPWVNVPGSRISASIFLLYYMNAPAWYPSGNAKHYLYVGQWSGGSAQGLLTVAEAKALDMKADDGMPGTGAILADNGGGNLCASDRTDAATYVMATAGLACTLYFKIGI